MSIFALCVWNLVLTIKTIGFAQSLSTFFFSPPANICAVTYMTEISLIVTLNNEFTSLHIKLPMHLFGQFKTVHYYLLGQFQTVHRNLFRLGRKSGITIGLDQSRGDRAWDYVRSVSFMYGSLRRGLWDEKNKMADNNHVDIESSDDQFKRHLWFSIIYILHVAHLTTK